MGLLLTDCDGVLLNWEKGFEEWMGKRGYVKLPDYDVTAYGLHIHYGLPRPEIEILIKQFNESSSVGFLQPFRDATEYVPKIFDLGHDIICITSMTDNEHSILLREWNLEVEFGPVIDVVIGLPIGSNKLEALKKYQNEDVVAWVDDMWGNCKDGHSLGYPTFMMSHDHNAQFEAPEGMTVVQNWEKIYDFLLTQELNFDNVIL